MKEAKTNYKLEGQTRKDSDGRVYKIIHFSHDCFINYYTTWLIEYVDSGKRFYKTEIDILKDKEVK